MPKAYSSGVVPASADSVWEVVRPFDGLPAWHPAIESSEITSGSAGEVGAIIRQIRQEKIRAMFIESIADPRLLERISRESGARIGGTLYADSLAKAGNPAATYLGMMRQNARTLAVALAD